MVLKENSKLVESAKIGVIDNATGVIGTNAKSINDQQTSFGFANNSTDAIRYAIQVSQKGDCYADYLLRKNGLVLEVYYNNSAKPVKVVNNFATTTDGLVYTNVLNYEILGNGDYVFKIKDLAGNVQLYNGFEPISATIIREVVDLLISP